MAEDKKKIDPRILRTRSLLRTALIDLVPEKEFDDITVQDITDRATLNRATFYLHFRDKHELLMDTFETLFNEVAPKPLDISQVSPEYAQQMLELVFKHISRYADFYCCLLGKNGDLSFISRVRGYVMQVVLNWFMFLQPDEENSVVPFAILTNFLGSAYMGVILWWLEQDMPYSAEYLATQLLNMTMIDMPRLLGLHEREMIETVMGKKAS